MYKNYVELDEYSTTIPKACFTMTSQVISDRSRLLDIIHLNIRNKK